VGRCWGVEEGNSYACGGCPTSGAVLPPVPQTNTTGEGYLIYPVM